MPLLAWNDVLDHLAARRDLTDEQLTTVLDEMMHGRCDDADAAAFLTALRNKGETAREIATAAMVLRRHMLGWDPACDVLDTCGTGGDGTGTFNISTAAAFVVAGAGVKVVKHGNRSVSSKSGSADVLAALGVNIEGNPQRARAQLARAGLAFCYAPSFHPALKYVASTRRRLGFPTIFNCLGPLANPAGAQRQLLGVGRPEFLERMADALAHLGTTRALLVNGHDGLDEVSLAAPTRVREVRGHDVRAFEWNADTFGLEQVSLKELAAEDATASALIIERVLDGEDGPHARIVIANVAAALVTADKAATPLEGVAMARTALATGRAKRVLEELRANHDAKGSADS